MNVNRRDFLKGLATLAGVAAVGLPVGDAAVEGLRLVDDSANVGVSVADGGYWVELNGWPIPIRSADINLRVEPLPVGSVDGWTTYLPGEITWTIFLDFAEHYMTDEPIPSPGEFVLHTPEGKYRGQGSIATAIRAVGPNLYATAVEIGGFGRLSFERV